MVEYRGHEADREFPMRSTKYQGGVGFVGFILIMALLIGIAVLGMRLFPAVTEFMTVEKTVKRIVNEAPNATPQEWRSSFDKFAQIDNITSLGGKDLQIDKTQAGASVAFSYDKKISLFGPASLLLEFRGGTKAK
jgi:Domain of unknown function (DUF4845)